MLREAARNPSAMSQLNVQMGEMLDQATLDFWKTHNVDTNSLDLTGSHGRTIRLFSTPKPGER